MEEVCGDGNVPGKLYCAVLVVQKRVRAGGEGIEEKIWKQDLVLACSELRERQRPGKLYDGF